LHISLLDNTVESYDEILSNPLLAPRHEGRLRVNGTPPIPRSFRYRKDTSYTILKVTPIKYK